MSLFDLVVKKEILHPNFKRIMDDPFKKSVLDQWSSGELIERDGKGKFIKEFQTTFNSSFWELYCYNVFKELGGTFDFSREHPDFVVSFNGKIVNIECAIANNAQGAPDESNFAARINDKQVLENIVNDQIIRLSNAFDKKYKKFIEKYNKKNWVKEKPFIIAIEPFDQPYFMLTGTESIRALLYGWKIEHDSLYDLKIEKVQKNENANLDMGIFLNQKYADISGVLFSNTATIGKVDAMGNDPDLTFGQLRYNLGFDRPQISVDSRLKQRKYDSRCKAIRESFSGLDKAYDRYTIRRPYIQWDKNYRETIFDGLVLFLNPYAKYPIENDVLRLLHNNGINIVQYDIKKDEDIWEVCDNSLIQRVVINLKKRFL